MSTEADHHSTEASLSKTAQSELRAEGSVAHLLSNGRLVLALDARPPSLRLLLRQQLPVCLGIGSEQWQTLQWACGR